MQTACVAAATAAAAAAAGGLITEQGDLKAVVPGRAWGAGMAAAEAPWQGPRGPAGMPVRLPLCCISLRGRCWQSATPWLLTAAGTSLPVRRALGHGTSWGQGGTMLRGHWLGGPPGLQARLKRCREARPLPAAAVAVPRRPPPRALQQPAVPRGTRLSGARVGARVLALGRWRAAQLVMRGMWGSQGAPWAARAVEQGFGATGACQPCGMR